MLPNVLKIKLLGLVVFILLLLRISNLWFTEDEKPVPAESVERQNTQKLLVTVYYEALCPDSRNFIIKQLVPSFENIEEYINLELVPYGKAETLETNNDYVFKCQHGEIECEANIVHACSIDKIQDSRKQLEIVACMIRNNMNPLSILKTCSTDMKVYRSILRCAQSVEGRKLLAKHGKRTNSLSPKVSFIPTITLDNEFDNQILILKDMLSRVCPRLSTPPDICKN